MPQTRETAALPTTELAAASKDQEVNHMTNPTPVSIPDPTTTGELPEPALMESGENTVDGVLIRSELWEEPDGTIHGYVKVGDDELTELTLEQMRELAAHLVEMANAAQGEVQW